MALMPLNFNDYYTFKRHLRASKASHGGRKGIKTIAKGMEIRP